MTQQTSSKKKLIHKKKKTHKASVPNVPFDPCLIVRDLYDECGSSEKPKVYVSVHLPGSNPILKITGANLYSSGIEGKPSLVLSMEPIKFPEHMKFEIALANQIIEFLRIIAKG